MISLDTAPARLRGPILSYLSMRFAIRLQNQQNVSTTVQPTEFTAADLLHIGAQIRMEDLYAGCFLFRRKSLWQRAP